METNDINYLKRKIDDLEQERKGYGLMIRIRDEEIERLQSLINHSKTIIKCEDCKFWQTTNNINGMCSRNGNRFFNRVHFCSWAVRARENNG